MEHKPLLNWFDANQREMPWRNTRDPYAIWVSEIMAQQTQIVTVIPFWIRWMERFPSVRDLGQAEEHEVLSLWQGLGYYRRARLLHAGAKFVLSNGMPSCAKEWEKVPGVGRYTAGAIASIAFGESVPVVDGNVERVFARLTACALSERELTQAAWKWAQESVPIQRAGDWNQALMELGATICTPKMPACQVCPVAADCVALKQSLVQSLPLPKKRKVNVELNWNIIFYRFEHQIGMLQAEKGDWWEGMYIPVKSENISECEYVGRLQTTVTHHKITLNVYLGESNPVGLRWMSEAEILEAQIPAPFRRALKMINEPPRLF